MQKRGAEPSAQAWKLGCRVMYPADKAIDWGGHHQAVSWEGDDASWRWVELHPAITSERTSQNNGRWRKRDLGPAKHAIQKSHEFSLATSSMTGRVPPPDTVVKPVSTLSLHGSPPACLQLFSGFVYVMELIDFNIMYVGMAMSADGSLGAQLLSQEHTASFCLIREHDLGDKDLGSLFTKCPTNHIRRWSRSYFFALQALPCIRPAVLIAAQYWVGSVCSAFRGKFRLGASGDAHGRDSWDIYCFPRGRREMGGSHVLPVTTANTAIQPISLSQSGPVGDHPLTPLKSVHYYVYVQPCGKTQSPGQRRG